jgi:hypothetical protein
MISQPNPVGVPAITYEYLLCPPASDQLWPPGQWRARGLLPGSSTQGTAGHRLWLKFLDTSGSF